MKLHTEKGFRSSIRYKWTAYFLIILLIPLIFNTASFLFYSDNIQDNINEKNAGFYENISNVLETSLSQYRKVGLELRLSPSVRSLANLSSTHTPEENQVNNLKNELRQYNFYLDSAYDAYVYFENLGMLGSVNGLKTCSSAFESLYSRFDIDYNAWQEWLATPYEMYWVLESRNNLTDVSSKYTLLKFPLYNNSQQQNTNLVVVLRDNYFSYQVKKIVQNDKVDIELYDRYDTLMCTTFNSDETSLPVRNQFENLKGLFETELQDTKMMVHYIILPTEGWKLVFYTPKNHYYQISRQLNQIGILMLVAVAVGLLLIQVFVKRQYRPLKNILKKIPSKVNGENEYSRIQNMMTESLKEHQKNELLHEKHEKNQFNRFLMQMLNTSGPSLVLDNIKDRLGSFFTNQPNQILLFSLDSYTQLFPEENIPDYERFIILSDMLDNMGSEVLASHQIESYFLESGGNMVALVNLPRRCDSYMLNEYLEEFLTLVKQHLNVTLTAGVSQPCAELFGLSQAYQEALTCLEYIRLNPDNRIVFYEDISKEQVISYTFSTEEATTLIRYIQQGEQEAACAYITEQFHRFIQTTGIQPSVLPYYIHDITNTLMKTFRPYVSEEAQSSISILHLLSVSKSANVTSIQNELDNLIKSLCFQIAQETRLNAEHESKKASLAYKIRDYIDQNYTDPLLCTESIAQEFGITSTYVSKIFKSIEEHGFVNYVNVKRIEKTKQLLVETSKKIDEIIEESGFLNTSSFIRLFKSHEGITPGNYRKLYKPKHTQSDQ
ncbi:MAG: helix-turn-helix domain-containing protein [Clostridia bacterium]|nr:helix-turn-helix domain-containing protein [Clostridia bacterium]